MTFSFNSSAYPPSINSDRASTFSKDKGHRRSSVGTGSGSISVLSVPLQDPYYIDLQALKADHIALYGQLKLAQQALHHSYQDLIISQERSKRAETDTGRLKTHLDVLFKKHVEHHPERQALVQQLGDLQAQLDIEMSSRKVLEQEHGSLQQELLNLKLSLSLQGKSAQHLPLSPRRSTGTSSSSSSLFNFNMGSSSQVQPTPSPTASVRSTSSSTFSSFFTSSSRRKNSNSDRTSIRSMRIFEKEEVILQEPEDEEVIDLQGTVTQHHLGIHTDSLGGGGLASPIQNFHRNSEEIAVSLESPGLTLEQLEIEKRFYERLREENVAMRMELQDLRHRNVVEKHSIKSYMSLFESVQKKQTNALAAAQVEIDLLKAVIAESMLRIESRESLLQTFVATVQSQAVDLERATCEIGRERISRAKVEQEMATLLEASLLMLERCFSNVEQTKQQLIRILDPMRQTVHLLEVPSIIEEWEKCEKDLQQTMNDLAKTLIQQQENQEIELSEGYVAVGRRGSGTSDDSFKAKVTSRRHLNRSHNESISSTNSNSNRALDLYQRRGSASSNDGDKKSGNFDDQASMLVLDNSESQNVFVWRKSMADSFLEECAQMVEGLAVEKRELQTRIMELTQAMAEMEEKYTVENAKRAREVAFEGSTIEAKEQETKADESIGQEAVTEPQSESTIEEVDQPVVTDAEEKVDESKGLKDDAQTETEPPTISLGPETPMDNKQQRLEAIFARVLALRQHSSPSPDTKDKLAETTVEEDVLALDIVVHPLEQDTRPTEEMLAETMETEDLELLIQMIRKELGTVQRDESCKDNQTAPVTGDEAICSALLTMCHDDNPAGTEDDSLQVPEKVTKKGERPSAIGIFQCSSSQSLSMLVSSPCSSSALSSASSMSSGYFSTMIGGLSTPSSPGIGIGLDGQLLDVDALCKDLAFRSFPKQHQWSKSRSSSSSRMAAGSSLLLSSASLMSLPPLPPTMHSATPRSS
ncbi:hypothetical protein BGZ74_007755 [Mortierella antarctica]|nr:hypothetical protein BGZ74_007755 [Mortierella antarctica]